MARSLFIKPIAISNVTSEWFIDRPNNYGGGLERDLEGCYKPLMSDEEAMAVTNLLGKYAGRLVQRKDGEERPTHSLGEIVAVGYRASYPDGFYLLVLTPSGELRNLPAKDAVITAKPIEPVNPDTRYEQ